MRAATVLTGLLLLTACGTAHHQPGLRTGQGVSDTTIELGVLSDLSGPFKAQASARTSGYELFVADLNAKGGVCGRKVVLRVSDHGYDVERAMAAYFELEPQVLGFLDITGAPMTAAIGPDLMQSRALAAPASWSAALLGNPHMMVVGTTYDLDVINGLDHLRQEGALREGAVIGHLHLLGDYGENALEGTTFFAAQSGMTVASQSITATTNDVTAQVAALRAAKAQAVVVTTTASQTQLAIAAAQNWNVPFLVHVVGYDPAITDSRVLVMSSTAPLSADVPGARSAAEAFRAKYPDVRPAGPVVDGYAVGLAFTAVLDKACHTGDLTREGVLRAFHDTNDVDTLGITAPLHFSHTGRPSSTQSYLSKPDSAASGGLTVVRPLFESPLVKLKATKAK
ncbi:ABC transporter substrate-binding protein [Lentzea tibetensis]|uniref:ABC transporter substrate-binding protein n=1 Tax=Lentzea tibetensis TaxID=2591470 RepID=UPI0016489DDA|nr:ABC transporter substrate-binding protein [Lentzea tibetensis]